MTDRSPSPIHADAAAELRAVLEREIYAFNVAATGIGDGQDVALSIRDADQRVAARLSGWTWGGCLYVEYLWVHAEHRGQGWGSALLARAEELGRARGCGQALLGTHSFQAPAFYLQRGYQLIGTVEEYPRGHQQYFLRKALAKLPDAG